LQRASSDRLIDEINQPLLTSVERCDKLVPERLGSLKNYVRTAADIDMDSQLILLGLRVINSLK
jgi:hypothetical protein